MPPAWIIVAAAVSVAAVGLLSLILWRLNGPRLRGSSSDAGFVPPVVDGSYHTHHTHHGGHDGGSHHGGDGGGGHAGH